jgi:hypothetical protein
MGFEVSTETLVVGQTKPNRRAEIGLERCEICNACHTGSSARLAKYRPSYDPCFLLTTALEQDHAMERFTGLRPPLYDKMKTLGHLVLGVYCLVHDQTDRPLSGARLAQITDYRDAIKAAAEALDTAKVTESGILPGPSPVYDMVMSPSRHDCRHKKFAQGRTQDICRNYRPTYRTRSRSGSSCANRCLQHDHGADPAIPAHRGRMV